MIAQVNKENKPLNSIWSKYICSYNFFMNNFPVFMLNFLTNKWIFTPIYNYPKYTHFTLYLMIKILLEDNNYLINLIANYNFFYSWNKSTSDHNEIICQNMMKSYVKICQVVWNGTTWEKFLTDLALKKIHLPGATWEKFSKT